MHTNTPHAPGKEEKEFAALSYLWIFSVLIYFSPYSASAFVKHHAKQAVILFVLTIIFYLLPGYFSYLSIVFVFLMVLGVVEAALGHWYSLPLIKHWVDGDFNGKRDFSLFVHWWKKGKNFVFHEEEPYQNPAKAEAASVETVKETSFPTVLKKELQNNWNTEVKKLSEEFEAVVQKSALQIQKFDETLVIKSDKPIMYFGGVEGESFTFMYRSGMIFLSGDEHADGFEVKRYNIHDFDRESFFALVQLIIDS